MSERRLDASREAGLLQGVLQLQVEQRLGTVPASSSDGRRRRLGGTGCRERDGYGHEERTRRDTRRTASNRSSDEGSHESPPRGLEL
jgi:hypothetical protein